MQHKTLNDLLIEANNEVRSLDYVETLNKIERDKCVIIDVREESELIQHGYIKNAINIPRGLIEFKLEPDSAKNPISIDDNTNILVYCAGGYRSALAAKVLQDLGFKNVFNIGGFADWVNSGGEIVK